MRRAAPGLAVLAAALLVPLLRPGSFALHVLILVAFWTLLGAAWNVLGGLAGQVSFGHAALVGVGAYTTMILHLKLGIAPWWGVAAGGAAAALASVPVGLLCFRLRGPYFSLATLAVAELVKLVALNFEALTNGAQGHRHLARDHSRPRGQARYPGYFWSATTGGHVIYESRLELVAGQYCAATWARSCPRACRDDATDAGEAAGESGGDATADAAEGGV